MNANLAAFVDSNVLVYAVSDDEPEKQAKAREIVSRGFTEGCFTISTQVMMEVYVNVTQKARIGLPSREALEYVRALAEWPVVEMTPDLVLAALALAQRSKISPWDAAILEAARQAGCKRVLSEDFGNGQVYGDITVANPFLEPNE
ncbi:MAG TPA: PIN domain-containing protein [Thermoanaerobaculia bacterium]|jgi:predicted nucleic acid-binding protein|nr:PIN domain-containing protein [Thermoanaerobaculia bacterium]